MKALALFFASVLGLAVAGGVFTWGKLTEFLETAPDPAAGEKVIVVPADATPTSVAALLTGEGLIEAGPWLDLYAEHFHPPRPIKAGEYALSRSMTPVQQFERIESGRVVTYTITIPNGATLTEIIDRLVEQKLGIREELLSLATDPGFLAEQRLSARSLEGYLIADAYNLPRGLGGRALLGRLLERYRELVTPEALEAARLRGLSAQQLLTLASLIEKSEVRFDERRLLAALLYNRLTQKIPLMIPAADAYGEGREPPVIVKGKTKPHRWNTSTRLGLPATPICSPSPDALEAALNPAPTRALYLVEREDHTHVFCEDLECYAAESARWHRPVSPLLLRPVPAPLFRPIP